MLMVWGDSPQCGEMPKGRGARRRQREPFSRKVCPSSRYKLLYEYRLYGEPYFLFCDCFTNCSQDTRDLILITEIYYSYCLKA